MDREKVLRAKTKILTPQQRQDYFDNGYLKIDGMLDSFWLNKLRTASSELIKKSRYLTKSNDVFILEEGHSAGCPRLKRLVSPVSHHSVFWDFASDSIVPDIVADVVGPNVRFYHSKLNYKWAGGGQRFDWHQDIQAWPHTNYSPLTVGVLFENVNMSQGPLTVIRGSHTGELYDLYDENDNFVIRIDEDRLEWVTEEQKDYMVGPAGTVFLLNCRTIHGSDINRSDNSRPLLLNVYSSADAFPYAVNPIPSVYDGVIVRGKAARWSHHDPRPCQIPPDWSGGYTGPWVHQSK